MRIFFWGVVAASAVLLAGCVSLQWQHPSKPAEALLKDQEECEVEAVAKVPRPPMPPPVVTFTGLAAVIRMMDESSLDRQHADEKAQYVQRCLQARGWALKSH